VIEMKVFVRSALFAALGVATLALGSGAQPTPLPAPPELPPDPPPAPTPAPLPGISFHSLSADGRYSRTYGYDFVESVDTAAIKLAKQIVNAKTNAEMDKLKDKLKETLAKQFDDRQKRHEKELEALEGQVKKLKEMVSKRQENKKEIIEERTRQLEREAKGLGW
jgi:hypothetical protein